MGTRYRPPCALRARQATNRARLLTAAAVAATAALSAPLARAQSWVGPGGGVFSGTFSTATNWSPATVPGTSSTAAFALNQNYTVTFAANVTNSTLVFSNTNGATTFTDSPVNTRTYTLSGSATFNDGIAIFDRLDLNVQGGGGLLVRTGNVLRFINGAKATVVSLDIADTGVGSNGTVSIENASSQLVVTSLGQIHPVGRAGNSGTLSFSDSARGTISSTLELADNVVGSKGFLNVLSGATLNAGGIEGGTSGLSLQLAALKVQDAGSILTLGDGAGIGGLLWGANAGPAMTVDILAGGTLKFNSAGIFTLNPTAVMTVNASTLDVVSTPIVINGALTVTNGAHVSQGTAGLSGTPFTVGSTNTTGAVVHIGGGTSTLFSVGQTRIGQGAAALFDQTGGTVTFDKQLQVGNGTYSMAGGSMTTPRIVIGGSGPTSFNHSGGTVTVPGTGSTSINGISIGNGGTQTATYNLSGASASLSVPGTTTVGDFSVGTFNQSGGNNTAGTLVVGGRAGIAGQYFLSGNALLGAFNVTVGLNGNGQFHQSGGTHTATTLQLGQNAGSTGAYDISAGTLNLQNLNIQGGGNGQFVLNSGSVSVTNSININTDADSLGICFIGGGTLSAGSVNVQDSFGSLSSLFTQIGGAVTLGSLLISGAHSNYSLTGGSLQVQFNETLAGSSFSQSDGSHTVNGTLTIGDSASYGLSGGTLTASLLQVLHNGVLFLSSGSSPSGTLMTVAGRVELDFGGASLTIPTTLFPDSAFNLQGDLTVASPVTLQGGTIFNTSLVRTPNVIVQTGVTLGGAGSVMPLVINKGLIEASGGALALRGSSLNNTGTLRNASGASLFIDATTLTNSGTVTVNAGFMTFKAPLISRSLTLAGGTLGTPLLTNTNGGSIRGFGQITGNVDNFAAIEFLGPTQIVGNFTNRAGATLTIRNDQTLITGQSVNNGTITTLNGKVIFDGGLAPAPVAGAPLAAAAPVPAGGGIDGSGIVSLNGASTLITSYVHQQELALNGTPTAPVVVSVRPKAFGGQASVLNTLTIPSSGGTMLGRLDLADTALLVNYTAPAASPLVSIRSAIISGNHGGDWTGNGITSSSAAANRATALGYAEATDVLTFTGGVASFQGQPADPTTVLVRHTLLGDATLDGVVDFNDLVKLAQNYNTNVSAITDSWWTRGDFTYDGTTDFNDLVKLAQNYNTALPDAPIPGASADFQRDLATAFATVPEPGALTAFALSGLLLTRPGRGRRRRMLICV